ncbi:MAG: hypothetical protein RL026_1047 [Pseudomonadota bacterium]|jgi:hypothetical protein
MWRPGAFPSGERLIVRPHQPWRAWALRGSLLVLLIVIPWLAFEWGRYRAAYDRLAADRRESVLEQQIDELEARLEERQESLARLEAAAVGREGERAEVAQTLVQLQSRIAQLEQDVAFYRGLATRQSDEQVVIQRIKLLHRGGRRFSLTIYLGRPAVSATGSVRGRVDLRLEGTQANLPVALEASKLGAEGSTWPNDYGYRFVQELAYTMDLPAGFEPQRLTVQLQPAATGAAPVRQTYRWQPEST